MKFHSKNDKVSEEALVGAAAELEGINSESTLVQVTVVVPTATAGTIAWEAKARNGSEYEPLQLSGVDYSLDVSTGVRTFSIPDKAIHALRGTPTGLNGTDWHFKVCATEG